MIGWLDFVNDLTDKENDNPENLDRFCMVQLDGKRWVASDNSIKPELNQIGEIYRILHSRAKNSSQIVIGEKTKRTFHVQKNNGLMLQAIGGKNNLQNEVLCVGRSRKYLILGGLDQSKDHGQCFVEIDHVRQHLKDSGS